MAKRKKTSKPKKTGRKRIRIEQQLEVLRSVVPIMRAELTLPYPEPNHFTN